MKARLIELKTLEAESLDGVIVDPVCDYREILLGQLNRIDPKAGLSYGEIEERLALRKSLREAGDTWIVSDKDWSSVKTMLKSERWLLVSENLITFIHDVEAAHEVEVDAKNGLHVAR